MASGQSARSRQKEGSTYVNGDGYEQKNVARAEARRRTARCGGRTDDGLDLDYNIVHIGRCSRDRRQTL